VGLRRSTGAVGSFKPEGQKEHKKRMQDKRERDARDRAKRVQTVMPSESGASNGVAVEDSLPNRVTVSSQTKQKKRNGYQSEMRRGKEEKQTRRCRETRRGGKSIPERACKRREKQ
jgi:hypothetical protein